MRGKMGLIWVFLFSFSLLAILIPSPSYSQEPTKYMVQIYREGAVLRVLPNENSVVIRKIPVGSILDVQSGEGDWLKVVLPPDKDGFTIIGFINKSFTEPQTIPSKAEPKVLVTPTFPSPAEPNIKEPGKKAESEGALEKKSNNSGFRFGISGGYAIPSNSNFKGGFAPGFQIGLGLGDNFALEIGLSRFQGDVVGTESGLSAGSLTRMPLELSLQGRFPLGSKKIVPYFFAGGGYSLNKFDIASSVTIPWSAVGVTITEKAESAVAFHAGIGLDFFIIEKLAININAKYLFSSAKGSWTQTDDGTGQASSGDLSDLKMNTLFINFGLKYSF